MFASLHPIVVHFAIALLVVGVLLRLASLAKALGARFQFLSPAATTLLLAGTLAAVLAATSGNQAEGVVETLPGVYAVLHEHEEWGERTRNVFLIVALAELLALALARRGRARGAYLASSALGVVGLLCLLLASARGGEVVYSYAGGVGVRTGDPTDVGRLLRAGLYQQMLLERRAGRAEEAALLAEFAARRFPGDVEVQLFAAESLLVDRREAAAALRVLQALAVPKDNRRLRVRHALLSADALEALGQQAGARALIQALLVEFPGQRRLTQRLEALGGAPAPQP